MCRHILLFLGLCLFSNCNMDNLKKYQVKKTEQAIQITGNGSDPAWANAVELTDFTYPWREENAPKTSFKALWDKDKLYFLYWAEDSNIIAKQDSMGEQDVVNSDRVEIFFKADDKMDPYYSLEMDALGRVLDTEGRYYRNVDFDWTWPDGELILKAVIEDNGYWVEGSISFNSLQQLGVYKENKILKAAPFSPVR